MTHRAPRLIVAALGLVAVGTLAACNDDTESSATSTTVAADTTVAAETTTTLPEVATLPPAETVAPTAPDGPVQIDVVVGVDSGPDREEHVKVGEDITLNITNPDAHDEFHIHGIDLEQSVEAGVMATFNFTADAAGEYEVESHETNGVLVVIIVE